MFRLIKIFSLLMVLSLLMSANLAWAADKAAPKAVFDKLELVFSDAREGQILPADFTFVNSGKANLVIDSITPSCGCATAEFSKVTPPGDKGVIRMKLDTTGITGAFRKTAVVKTNDPVNPFITLVMMGETQSKIKMDVGRRLNMIGCFGEDITATVTLTEIDGNPLIITGVDNPMKNLLETDLVQEPGGLAYKLNLRLLSEAPIDFAGPIYLVLPNRSKVSLFVVAEARGPFVVRPQEVFFGKLRQEVKTGLARSLEITKACADSLTIDRLIYDVSKFKVEEQWNKPGEQVTLVVTPLTDNFPLGPFEEKLAIQMGDKIYTALLKGSIN